MAQILALLLLPPPPNPPSPAAVEVAFRPPLRSVLRRVLEIASRTSRKAAIDIAIPCSSYMLKDFQQSSSSRKDSLESIQRLLVGLYALLSTIYSQETVGDNNALYLETRVILISYDRHFDSNLITNVHPYSQSCLVDLPLLALCDRNWTHVFIVDGEPGERLYRQFMAFVNGRFSTRVGGTWETERVGAGLTLQIASHRKSANDSPGIVIAEETPFSRIVAVIGYSGLLTLDQKLLLTVALLLAEFNSPETALSRSDKHPSSGQVSLDGESIIRLNTVYPDVIAFLHAILSFNIKSDQTSQTDKQHLQIYISPEGMLRVNSLIICVSGIAQLESLIEDGVSTTVVVDTETKVHVDSMNARRAALGVRALDVVEIPVLRDYLES